MFANRISAGEMLARELLHYRDKNPIVIAIPRGGVETGYKVAEMLDGELTLIVSRKLGYPGNPEAAFGAMAEDGSLYLNPNAQYRLTKDQIESVMKKEKKEIRRRIRTYRHDRPIPDLENRTVIIVDDGIATGSTLMAAMEMCKKKNPKTLVVASPVCGRDMKRVLRKHADHVVILESPENYYAVSQVYEDFSPVTDSDVVEIIQRAEKVLQTNTSDQQPV